MKTILISLTLLLAVSSLFAENEDRKPRVTVTLADGSTREYKLDWIDEGKVVVFERDTLKAVTFKRKEVASLAFGEDQSGKFKVGEEGLVMSDGAVVKGHPTSMDIDTYWIVPQGSSKQEKIPRDKVVFIQLEKRMETGKGAGGSKDVSTSIALVPSTQWADTGVAVEQGQRIWFTVSDQQVFGCGPDAPRVNADGKDPLVRDTRRPLPDVKQCALIAKIGQDGTPFRVGLNLTPFVADRKGKVFVEVNDYDFRDNVGRLDVYIKTGEAQ